MNAYIGTARTAAGWEQQITVAAPDVPAARAAIHGRAATLTGQPVDVRNVARCLPIFADGEVDQ